MCQGDVENAMKQIISDVSTAQPGRGFGDEDGEALAQKLSDGIFHQNNIPYLVAGLEKVVIFPYIYI